MKIKAVKRILDSALVVTLLLLMSFQVTQQFAHEWIGVTMLALTILHQVLNRKYYSAIFKGKYTPLRVFQLIVNVLPVLSFLCTAASGANYEPLHRAVFKRSFTNLSRKTSTPLAVALVVCANWTSPRLALRNYKLKAEKEKR